LITDPIDRPLVSSLPCQKCRTITYPLHDERGRRAASSGYASRAFRISGLSSRVTFSSSWNAHSTSAAMPTRCPYPALPEQINDWPTVPEIEPRPGLLNRPPRREHSAPRVSLFGKLRAPLPVLHLRTRLI
jgi:hypothetical protein